jgi:DNA polymerase
MTQKWTSTLRIDVESFSSADLTKVGVLKYCEAEDFDLLLFGYRFNGDDAQCHDLMAHPELPERVMKALYDPGCLLLAWNFNFEHATISEWLRRRGFPPLDIRHSRCTMIRAAMCGLPMKLSEAGKAAKISAGDSKLAYGRQLVKYFCMPCKPSKTNGGRTRNLPHHDPDKWALFTEYCRMDVVAEAAVDDTILNFPVDEREFARWHDDVEVNARGVAVDRKLVDNAIELNARVQARNLARMVDLTGVSNPQSVTQLKLWLEGVDGEKIESLNKKNLPELIANSDSAVLKEVLGLRQETSKSSIKKYQAMQRAAGADGRVRGLLQFYGAPRTGRESGRIVQVQNLRSNTLPDLDAARRLVLAGDLESLEMLYGSVPEVLSQLIRTAIVPAAGNVLVVADEKAIEARVLAWLADEEWRLEVFRTHGLLYEASASAMFNVPLQDFLDAAAAGKKHPLRKRGKVAELACGFQSGANGLIKMGALEEGLEAGELDAIVAKWRAASPRIASFDGGLWKRLHDASFECVARGRTVDVSVGPRKGKSKVTFQLMTHKGRRAMYVWLPSGRPLIYWNPSIRVGGKFNRECVSYEGYTESGLWGAIDTYGGKLAENLTQAVARDILFFVIDKCKDTLIFHCHDEVVLEVPSEDAQGVLDRTLELMATPVPWAPGLPLEGAGEIMSYYRKGD